MEIPGLHVPEGEPIIWNNKMLGKLHQDAISPLIQDEKYFIILHLPFHNPERISSITWLVFISNWINEKGYSQQMMQSARRAAEMVNQATEAAQGGRVLIEPPRRAVYFNEGSRRGPAAENAEETPRRDSILLEEREARKNSSYLNK